MGQQQYFTNYIFELMDAIIKKDYEKFKDADKRNGGKMHNIALGNQGMEKEIREIYKKARETFL